MTWSMIKERCADVTERYASFARKVSEDPWMSMPFVTSGGIGAVLACATRVAGCVAPFWHIFQPMFAACTAAHSALISPFQSLPTKRTTCQSLIKSTLHVAWALRAGGINAVVFDLFKHLSIGLVGENRYLLCFWDVVSVVTILPVIANPVCSFATGVIIVGGVGVVSLVSKYIADKSDTILSQEHAVPIEMSLIPLGPSSEKKAESKAQSKVEYPPFDLVSQQLYYPPAEGKELEELIEKYQVQGEYTGMSVGRENKITNLHQPMQPKQMCDVISLTKSEDQIAFERSEKWRRQEAENVFSIFFARVESIRNHFALELTPLKSFREWMQKLIAKQEQLANQLNSELNSRLNTVWKDTYSSFLICGEKELLQLGFEKGVAQKSHALVLYYKPVPQYEEPSANSQKFVSPEPRESSWG